MKGTTTYACGIPILSRSHRGARAGVQYRETGAPPFGLLQVAETIGGADWQPARMAFGETLARLIAEVFKAMCEPAALAAVLRKSNELAELKAVAQYWFEDDPQVAQAVEHARGRDRAKPATYLLQSVIARRRDRWADIVLRTVLWMREAPPEAELCWRELALVTKALVDGRDVTEIGLMRDIALRTITVLRDPGGRCLFAKLGGVAGDGVKNYIAISIIYEFSVLFRMARQ